MVFWFFGKKKNNEVEKLKDNLKGSFLNIKNDIQSIHSVLNFFKEEHNLNDQKFERLERDLAEIKQVLYNNSKIATRNLEVERSIVHERSRAFKRSNQSFMNVQSLKNLKEMLTPAQKRVIQLLNSTEIPLEYEDIAKELGISIITVRRHINDIKKMGFQVKEKMNIDIKRKVFYIEKGVKKAIQSRK